MPLPFIAIAVPVIHSSGGWIASTSAAGYIAGTHTATWIGSFILGNSSLLSSLGLISGAGIFAAGAGTGLLAGAASSTGVLLTQVGLGGVASYFGIAPVATFLGLTPIGWIVAGTGATVAGSLGYFMTGRKMKEINEARVEGGLPPITVRELLAEIKGFDNDAKIEVLAKLQQEGFDIHISWDRRFATIEGTTYPIRRLLYRVKKDGSEYLALKTRIGRNKKVLLAKPADPGGDISAAPT